MLMVISPAKTLDFAQTPHTQFYTQPEFLAESAALIACLKDMSPAELAQLMHLSDKLATLNVARFAAWSPPFDLSNAKQAILAFKGDVYTGLDADSLDASGLDFAQEHLRILSGLYGILRPLDLMQPYRLEMGTALANPKGKDLYAFWGDQLLHHLVREQTDGVLVNLASQEYFKVLQRAPWPGRVITPVFKDGKAGQYKMVSFYAKKARGLMARFVIDERISEPEALQGFDREGYRYSPELSQGDTWTFVRDHD